MAIGAGSLVSFTVGGTQQGQQIMNVFTYEVVGELGSPTAAEWGAAYWASIKGVIRPLSSARNTEAFQYVKVRELDSLTGEYGEYAVPTAEKAGTLGSGSDEILPLFCAAGVKLTVGSRLTRPGQKRIAGQTEVVAGDGSWTAGFLSTLNAFGTWASTAQTLGAPALGSEIQPVVVRIDPTTGLPTAHQNIVGFVSNPRVTSQVSRKIGRGA